MWIQTQNGQRVVNSDHIVDIFVDETGTTILAETAMDAIRPGPLVLGEYKDKDTSVDILEHISIASFSDIPTIPMPIDDEKDIEEWKDGITKLTAAHFVREFTMK